VAELVNELVWSHSRARAFSGCLRAYWFAYYGSWGGWEASAAAATREAYVQKKLTTRAMWTGTVVHQLAEDALRRVRDGWPPRMLEEAVTGVRNRARREIAESLDGSWLARPAKRTGFREHYYEEPVPPGAWEAAVDEIERQARALWAQRLFLRLHAVPERIRELEDLRRFPVGDVDVYVALDVMVDDGHGGVVILDWKTGENHDDADIAAQLGVYGLYATQVLGVPADKVVAMHVNLRHGTETRHPVGPAEIEAAREVIGRSAAEMRARLEDPSKNLAKMDDHPPLPLDDPRCGTCSFRGVCGRR
jgi:CRISPR/Cas system-associated exonuclease Cas4 (RecB family)